MRGGGGGGGGGSLLGEESLAQIPTVSHRADDLGTADVGGGDVIGSSAGSAPVFHDTVVVADEDDARLLAPFQDLGFLGCVPGGSGDPAATSSAAATSASGSDAATASG